MAAGTEEADASAVGFESGTDSAGVLEDGVGLFGEEIWAGWEYMGVVVSVGRLGLCVWACGEDMGSDGSMGRLGEDVSEVLDAVLGRGCGEGSMREFSPK